MWHCVDGDDRGVSFSPESTPLYADLPPASLSLSPQHFDQSQDAHLSREPHLPGVDTFLTAAEAAGRFNVGSCLPENHEPLRTKDKALEPRLMSTERRSEMVADESFPDNVLSSPSGVVGGRLC